MYGTCCRPRKTLLVLKLVPTGRIKDAIDVLSLLLDRGEEINSTVLISRILEEVNFRRHLVSQLRSYADFVRRGEAGRLWFSITGSRLSLTEKRKILKFIREIVNLLKI
ncbi:MAG: hypothetical protein QMD13_05715 [Candidatus Bathyarchaeia archaeon]|nr:hypothetical protein [Candidatus Bathyarchaeia archaeon]